MADMSLQTWQRVDFSHLSCLLYICALMIWLLLKTLWNVFTQIVLQSIADLLVTRCSKGFIIYIYVKHICLHLFLVCNDLFSWPPSYIFLTEISGMKKSSIWQNGTQVRNADTSSIQVLLC